MSKGKFEVRNRIDIQFWNVSKPKAMSHARNKPFRVPNGQVYCYFRVWSNNFALLINLWNVFHEFFSGSWGINLCFICKKKVAIFFETFWPHRGTKCRHRAQCRLDIYDLLNRTSSRRVRGTVASRLAQEFLIVIAQKKVRNSTS